MGRQQLSRTDDVALDAFQADKLLSRYMGTTDGWVTIAFLTQPLKTDEFNDELLTNRTVVTVFVNSSNLCGFML